MDSLQVWEKEFQGNKSVGCHEASSTTLGAPQVSEHLCFYFIFPPPQNLENEMSSHEALTQVVVGTGHKLVQAGHFAAHEVAARVQQLEAALDQLRAEMARRRLLLQQAQEAQQLLMEVRGWSTVG